MEKQTMVVPLPRHLLTPEDIKIDEKGNMRIDKQLVNKLVKENINNIPDSNVASVSVGVVVSF